MPTDTNQQEAYAILFPNDKPYSDGRNSSWPLHTAKIVARNVAMKHKVVVKLAKVEEPVTNASTFDQIVHYVDSLKGKALSAELKHRGLPLGGDAVASKRQRLISHLCKHGI